MEEVILVNEHDEPTGTMEKLEAHQKGLLHRAFSVFIFNDNKELLIHQRALGKYHSAGLWTNTCCSHPRPGESNINAAKRRLWEEMGMQTELNHAFSFLYKKDFENGLTEHELDHVFVGFSNDTPNAEPSEVANWAYISPEVILNELKHSPEKYTFWFAYCFERVMDYLHSAAHTN